MVCRLAHESMWSAQEIVKAPKREHRAQPYRIPVGSLPSNSSVLESFVNLESESGLCAGAGIDGAGHRP